MLQSRFRRQQSRIIERHHTRYLPIRIELEIRYINARCILTGFDKSYSLAIRRYRRHEDTILRRHQQPDVVREWINIPDLTSTIHIARICDTGSVGPPRRRVLDILVGLNISRKRNQIAGSKIYQIDNCPSGSDDVNG